MWPATQEAHRSIDKIVTLCTLLWSSICIIFRCLRKSGKMPVHQKNTKGENAPMSLKRAPVWQIRGLRVTQLYFGGIGYQAYSARMNRHHWQILSTHFALNNWFYQSQKERYYALREASLATESAPFKRESANYYFIDRTNQSSQRLFKHRLVDGC